MCLNKALVEIFEALGLTRLTDTSSQAWGILKAEFILLIW